jgi:hypothetical protein
MRAVILTNAINAIAKKTGYLICEYFEFNISLPPSFRREARGSIIRRFALRLGITSENHIWRLVISAVQTLALMRTFLLILPCAMGLCRGAHI